jgi:hypothetical protein
MGIIALIVIVLIICALFSGNRGERDDKEGCGCGCLSALLEMIGALTLLATCGACN